MKDDAFKKMDRAWMNRLKSLREKELPHGALKGLSASVEARIREKQATKGLEPRRFKIFIPVLVPSLAVLIIASVIVLRPPSVLRDSLAPVGFIPFASEPAAISTEIAALRELGMWTEKDEEVIRNPAEDLEELELS